MQVFLDDKPVVVSGQSLGDALAAVTTQAGSRLVIEALADGAPVPDDHLENPPEAAPYAGELRFRSADRAAIARHALHEAADALERVRSSQRDAAEFVRAGDVREALAALGPALEGWQHVRSAIDTLAEGGFIALAAHAAGAPSLEDHLQKLAEALTELKRAISHADWAALGDVLAYDLDEQAEQIGAQLRALATSEADRVEGASAAG